MMILADRPGLMTDLVSALGESADWRSADDLDQPTRLIWHTLAGGAPGWAIHLAPGGITVNGKSYPIELIIEDNASKSDQSVTAANKLISQDNVVAIIGPNASLGAIPAAEIAEYNKTLLITPWSTNPKTTIDSGSGKPKSHVFRACYTDPFEGRVLARFATQNLGAKKAAVFYDVASEAPKSQADLFRQTFSELGGQIVAFETYTTGDRDFSAQLTKIMSVSPD